MVRQGHLIAIVRAFLIVCAVVLAVGCAGVRSGAPQEEQEHTEATKEQGRSPEATASEEARCGRTKTIDLMGSASASASEPAVVDSSVKPGDPEARFVTNDVPGCPNKGGLLSGTDKPDSLAGEDGEDEVRGLGGEDEVLWGGSGSDVIYGGPGDDNPLVGGEGDDVIYGGDGHDSMYADEDMQRDKLYCGEGRDSYMVDKVDYVSSSYEVKMRPPRFKEGVP